MNRTDLKKKLSQLNIRPDAYSVDGAHPSEAYVLADDAGHWRVYYSGGQSNERVHCDEREDATRCAARPERPRRLRASAPAAHASRARAVQRSCLDGLEL